MPSLSEMIGFLPTCWLTNCLRWGKKSLHNFHRKWVCIYATFNPLNWWPQSQTMFCKCVWYKSVHRYIRILTFWLLKTEFWMDDGRRTTSQGWGLNMHQEKKNCPWSQIYKYKWILESQNPPIIGFWETAKNVPESTKQTANFFSGPFLSKGLFNLRVN